MRLVDKIFNIESKDYYGKFVVSLLQRVVIREIEWLYKVLNSFNVFNIESEVLEVSWMTVMLAYDGPDEVVLNNNIVDVWKRVEFNVLPFFISL